MAKKSAIQVVREFNEKKLECGSVCLLSSKEIEDISSTSSGILSLDAVLGVGGYPHGRIIEVYGKESTGKTTLTLHAIAETQRSGSVAAFIDAEHALNKDYASEIGVDTDNLIIQQPMCGEEALDVLNNLSQCMPPGSMIVIDSIAALTPRAELEGDMGDQHMGLQARLIGQAMRKITPNLAKNRVTAFFINQMRQKIGITFGSNETTTGGNAIKFYASIRMEVKRKEKLRANDAAYGHIIEIEIVKNKVAPPFKKAITEIRYGHGIPREVDVALMAISADIFEKSGSWYSFEKQKVGNGKENVIATLCENKELLQKIEQEVILHYGIKGKRAG